MIEVFFTLMIFCLIGWLIWYLIGLLPIPDPSKKIIQVCFIVIAILILAYNFLPIGNSGHLHLK